MPRRARLVLPEVPLHLIQRGNNRQIFFVSHDDRRFFLEWLGEYAAKAGCRIHANILMCMSMTTQFVRFSPMQNVRWLDTRIWYSERRRHGVSSRIRLVVLRLVGRGGVRCGLGGDAKARRRVYRALFRYQLDPGLMDESREAGAPAEEGRGGIGEALMTAIGPAREKRGLSPITRSIAIAAAPLAAQQPRRNPRAASRSPFDELTVVAAAPVRA